MKQQTLAHEVSAAGIGLHSGQRVNVRLRPGSADQGLVFVRVDLPGQPQIHPEFANACETTLCTGLEQDGNRVRTVEHLLASLVGMGIDNAIIELDNEEVPIFDGSAAPWIHLLREVGKTTLHVGKLSWQLNQTIEVRAGKGWARLTPADNFEASVIIDFDHPAIDSQASQASWNGGEDTFSNTIARARTFGFMEQVEAMSEKGLARGGSMENAVVYSQYEVVNPQGLRVADEVAQHKLLDAIGDLAVLGRQVLAHFEAHRPGHAINQALVAQARSSGALTRVRWSQALGGWMPQERKMGPAIPR